MTLKLPRYYDPILTISNDTEMVPSLEQRMEREILEHRIVREALAADEFHPSEFEAAKERARIAIDLEMKDQAKQRIHSMERFVEWQSKIRFCMQHSGIMEACPRPSFAADAKGFQVAHDSTTKEVDIASLSAAPGGGLLMFAVSEQAEHKNVIVVYHLGYQGGSGLSWRDANPRPLNGWSNFLDIQGFFDRGSGRYPYVWDPTRGRRRLSDWEASYYSAVGLRGPITFFGFDPTQGAILPTLPAESTIRPTIEEWIAIKEEEDEEESG